MLIALFIRLIIRTFQLVFFSWNSIFLSHQISLQCFSAGLSAQPNGATVDHYKRFIVAGHIAYHTKKIAKQIPVLS
jgi:hypothetical protein